MSGDSALRPWSVFVWSSAQPHNVRSMVEMGFGPRYIQGVWQAEAKKSSLARAKSGEGRLLGVWARDKMGLSESDYRELGGLLELLKLTVTTREQSPDFQRSSSSC